MIKLKQLNKTLKTHKAKQNKKTSQINLQQTQFWIN